MSIEHAAEDDLSQHASWRQIERWIEEIASLAGAQAPAATFHAEALRRAIDALQAAGGAIWTRNAQGLLRLEHHINFGATGLPESRERQIRHASLLDDAMCQGEARLVPPHSGTVSPGGAANPTSLALALAPVMVDGAATALFEAFLPPDLPGPELSERLRLLAEIAALAADYYRAQQLRWLRQERQAWQRLNRFLLATHGRLDLDASASAVANEGRILVGCDRMSVAVARQGRCVMAAISGVGWFDRRANEVRRLERLAAAAIASGEPVRFGAGGAEPPPQLESLLQEHVDEGDCRELCVIPLTDASSSTVSAETPPPAPESRPFAAVIVEQFQGALDEAAWERLESMRPHAALALGAALAWDQVPLARWLSALGGATPIQWLRRRPKSVLSLITVVAALLALIAIPADFAIEAPGELQPAARRVIFATSDGVVAELPARHGMRVRPGETLAVLRDVELEYERQRVLGELQTAQRRLAAVESLRFEQGAAGQPSRSWSADKEEIEEQINSLQEQLELLRSRAGDLTLRSPIAGEIITWDVERRLLARPVTRGQALLSVADLSGAWDLELRVPDRRMGHVAAARESLGDRLAVSYFRAADPSAILHGEVEQAAASADVDPDGKPFYLVNVSIDRADLADARPGAAVIARIHCGRRPLGYVWLHEVIESVRRWLWI